MARTSDETHGTGAVDAASSVDVCIATYRRPELLRRLLLSLRSQQLDDGVSMTLCVADNDTDASARSLCEELSSASFPVRYVCEPRRNISLARNAAIALGQSRFVAIVDDDEEVATAWLQSYCDAQRRHGADVLHGPVEFRFEVDCAPWIAGCKTFSRGGPLPTGASSDYVRSTTNCFFRRSVLDDLEGASRAQWFDPDYGLSGSEDSDFFDRLERAGHCFAWCNGATSYEWVPPERATLRWLIQRELRFGMNLAHRERRTKARRAYWLGALRRHRHAAGSVVRAVGRALLLRRQAAFDDLLNGFFFLGFMINHYTRRRFDAYW